VRVLLFGATGMVGQGVLRECLLDPSVTAVLSVSRAPLGQVHPKLEEAVRPDVTDLANLEGRLPGYDACFFCLGVSSAGKSEAEYTRLTYDLTLAVARTLARVAPGLTITYISGTGTDSTEKGRSMWARVKGRTENALLALPFHAAYMFRPGIIRPMHGIRSRTPGYRVAYLLLSPIVLLLAAVAPNSLTTTEKMGRAMIHVVERGYPHRILSTRDINALARE
jgi:uncharacterized protein YbjT (DUF2867 family)